MSMLPIDLDKRMPFCASEYWRQGMARAYRTEPLTEAQVDLAFLLVEAAGCGVNLATWRAFCHRIIEWRGATGLHDDVIVASDHEGHIKGLCVTQIGQSLLFGRLLDVPLFVSISAGDEDGVIMDLIDAVKSHARTANCNDIRIWTQGDQSWKRVAGSARSATHYSGVHIKLD